MTIVGELATFASAMPDNVGVGDVIQYDDDDDGDIDADDSLVFIHDGSSPHNTQSKFNRRSCRTAVNGDTDW